jgi:pyridoxamine 5'-phosphate oxidase
LEELEKKYMTQFANSKIPRPPHWGGFLIQPTMIEFWQGRLNRMHDRLAYYKVEKGWNMQRLAP